MKSNGTTHAIQAVSIQVPIPPIVTSGIARIRQMFEFIGSIPSSAIQKLSFRQKIAGIGTKFRSANWKKSIRRTLPIVLLVLIALAVLFLVAQIVRMTVASTKSVKSSDTRVQLPGPKASMILNKEFSFPLYNDKGKEITKMKYTLESAELHNEIIVKGQRASAVSGRTFLTLSIKLTNDYNQPIKVDTRDYVRLIVNGNEKEQLAADIHNDTVTIQAISTKSTRLGFPINDTDKNLSLKVGELNGTKDTIPLTLQ